MRIAVYKCDGPDCDKLSETGEGWVREDVEPYRSGLPPYCETVNPTATSGNDMLFVYLRYCSKKCRVAWWTHHNKVCGCHGREMEMLIRLPIPYADAETAKPLYMSAGELLDLFGRYAWPKGAEWCCSLCLGPVEAWYGDHRCLDPVCHAETPKLSYGY